MLQLLLLRHAKSSWDDPALEDHERQLTKRGTKAARRMGRYLADENIMPDLIVSSDAIRTRATLTLLMAAAAPDPMPPITFSDDLYLPGAQTILDVVRREAGAARSVMVVAHNPGLQALALSLTRSGAKRDLEALAMKFPTAALAELTFDAAAQWDDVAPASGHLARLVVPRDLMSK